MRGQSPGRTQGGLWLVTGEARRICISETEQDLWHSSLRWRAVDVVERLLVQRQSTMRGASAALALAILLQNRSRPSAKGTGPNAVL
jgi:hypothetical protein